MKSVIGLVSLALLAGCRASPQAQAVATNAAMVQASLEQQADAMAAEADNAAADPAASAALDQAADRLEATKDNVAATADRAKRAVGH